MNPDSTSLCFSGMKTGMARAVMHEIAECMQRLAAEDQESAIDLRSLPLTEADLLELETMLGKGEVEASLSVLGQTQVWETGYAGVWWVRHFAANQQTASEQIAITPLPEILISHPEDISAASDRLRKELAQSDHGEIHKEASHG